MSFLYKDWDTKKKAGVKKKKNFYYKSENQVENYRLFQFKQSCDFVHLCPQF